MLVAGDEDGDWRGSLARASAIEKFWYTMYTQAKGERDREETAKGEKDAFGLKDERRHEGNASRVI